MIFDWKVLDKDIVYEELFKSKLYISSKSHNGTILNKLYNDILNIVLVEMDNLIFDGKEMFEIEHIEEIKEDFLRRRCSFESLYCF